MVFLCTVVVAVDSTNRLDYLLYDMGGSPAGNGTNYTTNNTPIQMGGWRKYFTTSANDTYVNSMPYANSYSIYANGSAGAVSRNAYYVGFMDNGANTTSMETWTYENADTTCYRGIGIVKYGGTGKFASPIFCGFDNADMGNNNYGIFDTAVGKLNDTGKVKLNNQWVKYKMSINATSISCFVNYANDSVYAQTSIGYLSSYNTFKYNGTIIAMSDGGQECVTYMNAIRVYRGDTPPQTVSPVAITSYTPIQTYINITETDSILFNVSATDGTAPLGYTWFLDSVIQSYNQSWNWTVPTGITGTLHTVMISVNDSTANTANSTWTVNVSQPPTLQIISYTPSSLNTTGIEGYNITFNVTDAYGTGATGYTWILDSVVQAFTQAWTWVISAGASLTNLHIVQVLINDTLGNTASKSWTINISSTFYISSYSPESTLLYKSISEYLLFNISTMNGSGETGYAWYIDDVIKTYNQSWSWNITSDYSVGSHTIGVIVNDSVGHNQTMSWTVNVAYNQSLVDSTNQSDYLVYDMGGIPSANGTMITANLTAIKEGGWSKSFVAGHDDVYLQGNPYQNSNSMYASGALGEISKNYYWVGRLDNTTYTYTIEAWFYENTDTTCYKGVGAGKGSVTGNRAMLCGFNNVDMGNTNYGLFDADTGKLADSGMAKLNNQWVKYKYSINATAFTCTIQRADLSVYAIAVYPYSATYYNIPFNVSVVTLSDSGAECETYVNAIRAYRGSTPPQRHEGNPPISVLSYTPSSLNLFNYESDTIAFNVVAEQGTGELSYKWSLDGAAQSTSTNWDYVIPIGASSSNNPHTVEVFINDTLGMNASVIWSVNVSANITNLTILSYTPLATYLNSSEKTTILFNISINSTNELTYNWSLDNSIESNNQSWSWYIPEGASLSNNPHTVRVAVNDSFGSTVTSYWTINVSASTAIPQVESTNPADYLVYDMGGIPSANGSTITTNLTEIIQGGWHKSFSTAQNDVYLQGMYYANSNSIYASGIAGKTSRNYYLVERLDNTTYTYTIEAWVYENDDDTCLKGVGAGKSEINGNAPMLCGFNNIDMGNTNYGLFDTTTGKLSDSGKAKLNNQWVKYKYSINATSFTCIIQSADLSVYAIAVYPYSATYYNAPFNASVIALSDSGGQECETYMNSIRAYRGSTVPLENIKLNITYYIPNETYIEQFEETSILFNITAINNTGNLSYIWRLDNAIQSYNQSWNWTIPSGYSLTNPHNVSVYINDTLGVAAEKSWNVNVSSYINIASFTPNATYLNITEGDTILFNISVINGTGNLSYAWSLDNALKSNNQSWIWNTTGGWVVPYTVRVIVNDSVGHTISNFWYVRLNVSTTIPYTKLHWTFDGLINESYTEISTSVVGTPLYSNDSVSGQSLNLTNLGVILGTPALTAVNNIDLTGTWTVAFWLKGPTSAPFTKHTSDWDGRIAIGASISNDKIIYHRSDVQYILGVTNITELSWNHFVFRYNGSTLYEYLDGNLENFGYDGYDFNIEAQRIRPVRLNCIGDFPCGTSQGSTNLIDELYIWAGTALNDTQILALANLNFFVNSTANLSITNVRISPIIARNNDTLEGYVSTINNATSVYINYTWFKNNDYFSSGTHATSTSSEYGIGSITGTDNLTIGSNWTLSAKLCDINFNCYAPMNSSIVTINNSILRDLTILSPASPFISNRFLNVSFSVVDEDQGIVCDLNMNNSVTTNTSVTSNIPAALNISYNILNENYLYNISCISNGDTIPLISSNRFFGFDDLPPNVTNIIDDQSIIYPQLGDTLHYTINLTDVHTIDSCVLTLNDTAVWHNSTIIRINQNYTNISSGTILIIGTTGNTSFDYGFWCNDTLGNKGLSLLKTVTVKDTTNPIITINPNNGFSTNNNTIISSRLSNLSLNISFADSNLFQSSVNINCSINNSYFYYDVNDINTTIYTLNLTVDLNSIPTQICYIRINSSDEDISGGNVANVTYSFYIGNEINVSAVNAYDSQSLNNFNVTVTTIVGTPVVNQTYSISGFEYWIPLTNGIYNFEVKKANFLTKNYNVNISGTYQNLVYNTSQGVVYLYFKNIKEEYLTNVSGMLNNTVSNKIIIQNGTGLVLTYYLNATTYKLNATKSSYNPYSTTFTVLPYDNVTYTYYMSLTGNFMLYDERTHTPFDIASARNITFQEFCPNGTFETSITSNNINLPITCDYKTFRFLLDYGTLGSFQRSFILTPTELNSTNIYLLNLNTTQYVLNSFIVEDLFNNYDDVSVRIFKTIDSKKVQITADYVDIENKITAYLQANALYSIEIYSSNQPTRILGSYSADFSGNKNIRLYEFSVSPIPTDFNSKVLIVPPTLDDSTGTLRVISSVNDSTGTVTKVEYIVYSGGVNGNVLCDSVYTDLNSQFVCNVPPNTTIVAITNITSIDKGLESVNAFGGYLSWFNSTMAANLATKNAFMLLIGKGDAAKGQAIMNWFITIFIALFAMMFTIRTADLGALVICGFGLLLRFLEWYTLSWAIIFVGLALAAWTFLKGESDQQ